MKLLIVISAIVNYKSALGQDLGEGPRSLQRKLQERSPVIVPSIFQPNHTSLSPGSLKYAENLYGKVGSSEPHRPLIFVNSTQPLWMCTASKTGCTAWGAFILYVNMNISVLHSPPLIYTRKRTPGEFIFNSYNPFLAAEFKTRDRVWIVRNPYVRLISSYLDWQGRNKAKNSSVVSFEVFVSMYENEGNGALKDWVYLPSHVHPVSDVCRVVPTLGPDVFLRIEQMDLWYDTFMNHYGLGLFEARHQAEHGSEFYRPNLSSETSVAAKLAQALGSAAWSGKATRTGHEHHSSDQLTMHYTPALARKVFDLQRRDFEEFGYPAWDGDPASFAFV